MDWVKISRGIVETIQKYMNDADGWKQVKKSVSVNLFISKRSNFVASVSWSVLALFEGIESSGMRKLMCRIFQILKQLRSAQLPL